MSTETLPDLGSAFTDAMKASGGDFQLPPDSPLAKAVAEPVKAEPVKSEPVKTEEVKTDKPADVKPVETKKKSALDAAISDEVPAPEATPDEVQQLLEAKDPNWSKARETLKTQSQKIKDYEAKLAQASAPAPEVLNELKSIKAEREKLAEENAKMRDSIMALDVRYDPQTQEKIAHREKQATTLADRVAEAGGDKAAFLEALNLPLSKRGKALDEALSGVESQRELATINTKLSLIEQADEQLDEMLSKPHQTFEEMKRQREVQAREQFEKAEQFKNATFDNVKKELPKLSKLMRLAPEDSEGAKEFNEALLNDLQKAPQLLDVEPRDAAIAAYKAARYDSVEKIALNLHGKVFELESELSKFHGAEPGFRGGGKPTPKQDYDMPLEKVFTDLMNGQQPV